MTEHLLSEEKYHTKWDHSLPPVLEIDDGDIVHFSAKDGFCGQLTRESTPEILPSIDWDKVIPLTGPVYIKGMKPGDVLKIEILETKVGSWGWTAILPGWGLLPEDFPDPYLKIWDFPDGKTTKMNSNIVIPLNPFCGTMGVCPAEDGPLSSVPPGPFGGNMDLRHLHKGSTLLLPAQVEGGLFSVGDGHAVQGDAEVCVSAIETSMQISLRFNVRRDISIQEPQFICKSPLPPQVGAKGYYGTMGIGPDLKENAKKAIRYMIEHLVANYGLSREDAYVLCSVILDVRIDQLVDVPNFGVSAYLPLSIFRD